MYRSSYFEEPRASTAAYEDVEELSRLQLQIQHFLAALLLPVIIPLPHFVQLGQEGANISVSHGFLSPYYGCVLSLELL
jgi:hypothetical protein